MLKSFDGDKNKKIKRLICSISFVNELKCENRKFDVVYS